MRIVNLILLAIGAAALAWLISRVGLDSLGDAARQIGAAFALGVGFHFLEMVFLALQLRRCAGLVGREISGLFFLRAGLAGHAINEATPMAKLGELTKYSILSERLDGERAAAALIVQNVIFLITGGIGVALAIAVALAQLPAARALTGELVAIGSVFLVMAALAAVLLFVRVGEWPFRLLGKLGVGGARRERWRAAWSDVESAWGDVAEDRRQLVGIFFLGFAARAANVAESAVILGALGVEPLLAASLIGFAAFQIAYWLTSFVPLQTGTAEGGAYAVFSALGLVAANGLILELARKLRRIAFIAGGLLILGVGLLRRQRRS